MGDFLLNLLVEHPFLYSFGVPALLVIAFCLVIKALS